ncbi:hypothetical protein Hamer_G009862 [Homarus americanus]|uniref:Uncharacterized protein n=1 Tax=Homarus americanus TaxID=6706 RepID=A0A8J5NAM6_HOMAM|nr:hypothetical protein Hamer_G009862 [Homarus americanus]
MYMSRVPAAGVGQGVPAAGVAGVVQAGVALRGVSIHKNVES